MRSFVNLTIRGGTMAAADILRGFAPLMHRFGSKKTKGFARYQVTLDVEGVVNSGMGGQKALRRSW